MDGVIDCDDLDAINGVEGGLRSFAEDALKGSLHLDPKDREAFKSLFSQLYSPQPDGTLTTLLIEREKLEGQWHRPTSFADLLEAAKSVRLLREDELRIQGDKARRYVRLGHDALAKVAAAWQAEREEKQRLRKYFIGSLVIGCVALLFALVGLFVAGQNRKLGKANTDLVEARKEAERAADKAEREANNARESEQRAKRQERIAQLRLMRSTFSQVDQLWRTEPERGLALLMDPSNFPLSERDFAWGYYFIRCNRVQVLKGHENAVMSVAFSPDGWTLASGSVDNTVRLWDAAYEGFPTRVQALRGHH